MLRAHSRRGLQRRTSSDEGPPPLEAGTTILPGYEVIAHLSRGNRLDVYDVWSLERRSRVVVKCILEDRTDERMPRRKLMREGRLLRDLTHPNLVRAYEVVREPIPAIVLETLTGATLSAVIDERRRFGLRVPDVAVLGLQLCSVVGYLHDHDVLHLDLKPSNIVVQGGQAKLLDLSVATPPGHSKPGAGTREYMSPEQCRGGQLDAAADVWGIGMLLWETLTLHHPWGRSDGKPQRDQRAPSVTTRRRRLPAEIATITDRCLEPVAADRPTIPEVATALETVAPAGLRAPAPWL